MKISSRDPGRFTAAATVLAAALGLRRGPPCPAPGRPSPEPSTWPR